MMHALSSMAGPKLRRLTKAALASVLSRTRVNLHVRSPLRAAAPLVLGYHRVVEKFDPRRHHTMPGMLVSRSMLERHLDTLARRYQFVSVDELGTMLEEGRPADRPLAAVTFDDGYRDVYENAVPLLVRKGIPAAMFVVSDLIGTRQLLVHDQLYLALLHANKQALRLSAFLARWLTVAAVPASARVSVARASGDPAQITAALMVCLSQELTRRLLSALESNFGSEPPEDAEGFLPMTWEMLADMQRKGITIGSHSCTHARLANETNSALSRETSASRERLQQRLGVSIRHFAYPNGSFNSTAVRAVAESGYHFAYTTCSHQDRRRPLLTIPRVLLWEHSSVDGAGEFMPEILDCQARGFMNGKRACQWRSHR